MLVQTTVTDRHHTCVCLQAAGHVLLQRWLAQPGPLRAWLVNQPTLVNTCMGVLLGEATPPPTPPPAAAAPAAAAAKGKPAAAGPVVVDPQVGSVAVRALRFWGGGSGLAFRDPDLVLQYALCACTVGMCVVAVTCSEATAPVACAVCRLSWWRARWLQPSCSGRWPPAAAGWQRTWWHVVG
jgi:hypothetical protein